MHVSSKLLMLTYTSTLCHCHCGGESVASDTVHSPIRNIGIKEASYMACFWFLYVCRPKLFDSKFRAISIQTHQILPVHFHFF